MIRYDCVQGSEEWFRLRAGIPTASQFCRIITPASARGKGKGKGKPSTQSAYAYRLVAERLLGQSLESIEMTEWMQRGVDFEERAAAQFNFIFEASCGGKIEKVGFITTDDGLAGASPDRLILLPGGEIQGLEIKAPSPQTHTRYLVSGPGEDYQAQIQGSLWVSGLDVWHFFSFHPSMPPLHLVVRRDEEYIARLATAVTEFAALVGRLETEARGKGMYLPSAASSPHAVGYGHVD